MTEIEALPIQWSWTKLGEIFHWGSGGTPLSTNASFYDGDIPWAIIGDLNDGVVNKTARNISDSGLTNSSAKWVEPGSILLAMYGSIGKLGIAGTRMTTNQAIAFTNPQSINGKYLFYYLLKERANLLSLGSGNTQRNISQTVIKAYPFPLAPLPEQNRIVTKLDELFSKIDASEQALKRAQIHLKQYRQSVLQSAVTGELTREWREAHRSELEPASELLARICAERRRRWEETKRAKRKDLSGLVYEEWESPDRSGLPDLPEGWCWANIGSLFDVSIGSTPSRGKQEYWAGTIPWVSSGEVAFCRIHDTKEKITKKGLENSSVKIHPAGTVLLGMIGEGKTRGQAAILDIEAGTNQNIAAILVPLTPIKPEWLFYWFLLKYSETRKSGSGGMQYALNSERVKNLLVIIPPLVEQERIISEIERKFSICDHLEKSINNSLLLAHNARKTILARAFSGQLVFQDPNDEPASILLERIQVGKPG